MGTPDFAAASLRQLKTDGWNPLCVVTQPDRPKGRGRRPAPPPVKETAQNLMIRVVQPASIRSPEFMDQVKHLQPDLLVVVAFGRILPPGLLDIPKLGAINLHASLLPKFRGPAPIQRAIIDGESVTGVTTMLMDRHLDSGDILLQRSTPILPDDTAGVLHDRLGRTGAELLSETLEKFTAGRIHPLPQDHAQATYAPMLKKSDGRIDWRKPAQAIDRLVRGFSPNPGAYTFYKGRRLKLYKTGFIDAAPGAVPGTVLQTFSDELRIATGRGVLQILEIQSAAGKRLPTSEFLRGNVIPPGSILDDPHPAV